jgi:mannose-6-phosphate isomerase-like protein (cupin superfamily)
LVACLGFYHFGLHGTDRCFESLDGRGHLRRDCTYNGNELRLAKLQGEFTWHSHADTDELFLVVSGALRIAFRDGVRDLAAGEMLVVPRGVEHCPMADEECAVLVIDREGEPNTGANPSHYTRVALERI